MSEKLLCFPVRDGLIFVWTAASYRTCKGGPSQELEITAPLVDTYYAAQEAGASPFISVGDMIRAGQIVCFIEAMKMVSEIPAPCDCVITEILKENGTLAEFQESVFRYRPC